ncbi:MAG TPA: SCO family protein [Bryocella sp.]|nr:SCO family protein [Bryocella sp.]
MNRRTEKRLSIAVLILTAVLGGLSLGSIEGCHRSSSTATSTTKQYPFRATVVAIDAQDGQVTLQHDAIAGLMEAMTMSYPVTDRSALSELHPGDKIMATMLADPSSQGPVNLRVSEIVIIAQAKPDYVQAVQYHVPTKGDKVPNFTLLNQSDKTIDLDQYRGKVLLMTFIYTRCPLADYCPRMSHNFAQIDQQLAVDPKLYKDTHLLTVSFDPTYDTPKVLRSYGGAYTGRYSKETFNHWEFAAPSEKELPKMEQFFCVGVTPGEKGTLQHSLATVVIGKDGKVIAFYPTNDWSVATVLQQVKQAAAS